MPKKWIIASIAAVLVAAVAAYLAFTGAWKGAAADVPGGGPDSASRPDTAPEDNAGELENTADSALEPENEEEAVALELEVLNNTAEFDLRCFFVNAVPGARRLRLEYYLDGEGVTGELGSEQLEELAAGAQSGDAPGSAPVKRVILNPLYEKVYILLEAPGDGEFRSTALYSYGLRSGSPSRVFSEYCKLTDLYFSKDFRLMGYTFLDSPASSVYQEAALLEIVSCEKDDRAVKGSRTADGRLIGRLQEPGLIYDYHLLGWSSNTVAKLREESYPKAGGGEKQVRELLYDVAGNALLNAGGTPLTAEEEKPAETTETAGAAVEALKQFYELLSDGSRYKEAMELLDSGFTIELDLFRQFGLEALTKSDIDLEEASLYGELLKAAKLESLVKEERDGEKTVLYYYQVFSTEQAQTRQAIKAELVLKDKKWLLFSVKERNPEEEPFNNR